MGFFDFLKEDADTAETSDDPDEEEEGEEEETWPKYRETEETAERELSTYEYDLGNGETVRFDHHTREENHIEFYEREVRVGTGTYGPMIEEVRHFKAALPLGNIDGVFEPEEVETTTYTVDFTLTEEQKEEGYHWRTSSVGGVGDIKVVDE